MKIKNIFYVLLFSFSVSFCAVMPSTDLIGNAQRLDNNYVEYQGEAVGDLMVRGDNAWLNIHDGNNAVGVWGKKSVFKNVVNLGNYFRSGDIVLIRGVFNRACLEHGGDLDIHAYQLEVVRSGYKFERGLSFRTVGLALFWIVIASVLSLANKRQKR